MIEAVENHMPEVIVIDEIGTELEALAARTIAERGVQLVGTAHGNTLDNLMLNPTLSDLVGGIQSVTLGDEEARRRGTQKTVLERKAPPTFDVLVEIVERDSVIVHRNVAETVDAILRGHMVPPEARFRNEGRRGEGGRPSTTTASARSASANDLRAAGADGRLRCLRPWRAARRTVRAGPAPAARRLATVHVETRALARRADRRASASPDERDPRRELEHALAEMDDARDVDRPIGAQRPAPASSAERIGR